jgi:hypothetical protein
MYLYIPQRARDLISSNVLCRHIYDRILPGERARLHGAIAHQLITAFRVNKTTPSGIVLLRIAHHKDRAGEAIHSVVCLTSLLSALHPPPI